MQYRALGNSDIEASTVALGTWAVGGWMWGGTEEKEAVRAIQAALDAGIDFIDTAPIYGFGRSEEIVGRAIAGRREHVVLATKCGLVWGRDEDKGVLGFRSDERKANPEGDLQVRKYLAPDSIRREVEESLRRLKVDVIDLFQTHWQEPTTPIGETMGALMELRMEGKIRAIGVCNATPEQMDEYRRHGVLASDQEKFSLLDRRTEAVQLAYSLARDMAFLAYSPLELGLLTGGVGPDREFPEGDLRRTHRLFTPEARRLVGAMLDEFRPLAAQHGATLAQLVVAWTLAQPGCSHVLVGARTTEHAVANAKAGSVSLDADALAVMDSAARATIEKLSKP